MIWFFFIFHLKILLWSYNLRRTCINPNCDIVDNSRFKWSPCFRCAFCQQTSNSATQHTRTKKLHVPILWMLLIGCIYINWSLAIVFSTVYSDADQRTHHRGPVNSPHKWPVRRKCFHMMPGLAQIMAWPRPPDDKPLSVPILTQFTGAYMRNWGWGVGWWGGGWYFLVMMYWCFSNKVHYKMYALLCYIVSLHWRHNDHGGVSNHQRNGCLLNRLFVRRSKKTSKLRATGLWAGNSPGPVNFPHKWPVTRKMFPFDDVIM